MPLRKTGEGKKVEPILVEYVQWIEDIIEEKESEVQAKEAKNTKDDDEQD